MNITGTYLIGTYHSNMAKKEQKTFSNIHEYRKHKASIVLKNLVFLAIFLTIISAILLYFGYIYVLVFVIIGLLPSIFGFSIDKRKKHHASKTVFAFNISGLMPYLSVIAVSGSPNQIALRIITEFEVWFIIYGFSAFGVGCIYLIPAIVRIYLEIKIELRLEKIKNRQEEIEEEWGKEVTTLDGK